MNASKTHYLTSGGKLIIDSQTALAVNPGGRMVKVTPRQATRMILMGKVTLDKAARSE